MAEPAPGSYVSGQASSATTSSITILGAPADSSQALYVSSVTAIRNDAGTLMAILTLNDRALTLIPVPPVSAGGYANIFFAQPLVVPAGSALIATVPSAITTMFVGAQGYRGLGNVRQAT